MSPTTTSTTSIEDLPPEMISELFGYLPPKDLVACSQVNKRWYSIYAAFKLQSLVTIDSEDFFRWYHSNQPIQEAEQCRRWMFVRLAKKPLLSNLKHLALCDSEFEFDFNDLNRFEQLVHLEMATFPSICGKIHLNLPRLKVLAIHYWDRQCPLTIDAPELSTLLYGYEDAEPLKVKHPETIRMLETNIDSGELGVFKGVKCLVTEEFEKISKTILLTLPKLRELRYDQDIEEVFAKECLHGAGTVNRVRKMLSQFMDGAKKLRDNDFRFRFAGLQLNNEKDVNKIDVQVHKRFGEEYVHNEYVYMKNYHLIESDALHFVHRVNYTSLLSHVTGEFPRCFSQKFTGIERVEATAEVQDPDHFLWFLRSLRFLRKLELAWTKLGQEFYDQLPASAPYLASLVLGEGHCKKGLQVNFDFFSRLSRLSELTIGPAIWSKSLPSLTRSLSRLKRDHLTVRSGWERFKIDKTGLLNKMN